MSRDKNLRRYILWSIPFNTQISNISIRLAAKEKGLTKAAIAIAVEVDGPSSSHFIVKARSPTGSTTLKRRQVPEIHGIELVFVPHW
eukprot:scaffold3034_cov110-Skeletonema_dohrnii-CCMP3373.AAC.10